MPYPRRCPLCNRSYAESGKHVTDHVTVRAESGGTPSPSSPELPGRLLVLRCLSCGGEYGWDYFADAKPAAARSGLVAVRRRGPGGATVIEYLPVARSY